MLFKKKSSVEKKPSIKKPNWLKRAADFNKDLWNRSFALHFVWHVIWVVMAVYMTIYSASNAELTMTSASMRVTGAGKTIIQTHYAHLIAYAWDLACYMSAFFIAIGLIFVYLSFKKTREYRKNAKAEK